MAYDEDLAQRLRTHLAGVPGLTEKKMFGGVGFMVNGNMACGVHKQYFIARLSAEHYEQAMRKPHVKSNRIYLDNVTFPSGEEIF